MSNSYTIPNTDGTNQITITAGAVNGNVTGSVGTDTDLILYGRGSFNWGQGIEQNLIRLTENWASPSEVTGASVNTQVPKSYAGTPNKGITSPIVGQNWFNKSNNRPYVYTATGWQNDAAKHGVQLNPAGSGAQVVTSDLKLATASPDMYVQSTAAGYTGNAHVIFQGNRPGNEVANTAVLYSSHGPTPSAQSTPDAVYLRKFMTRSFDVYDETGEANGYLTLDTGDQVIDDLAKDADAVAAGYYGLAKRENNISNQSNQMKMTDFVTEFSQPLRISGNSTGGFVADVDVPGLNQNTLTTKRVVEELIELNTNAQPDYVPMTGTRPFDAFNTTTLASYMTGNLGIQARIGTSGPNSDARLIMGFTGTTTQDTGFVTLESHNPRFLANTKNSGLDAEPMYALGIEGTMKARMFVKRGHWDATKFADADPELHNPDNLKEWFAAPINQGDPAENKYGIKNDQDTLGIIKYNRFTNPDDAVIANGFIIFDKWIETVKDTGMIRTTSPSFTYSGDDPDYDRTLATIQSVKGYVASAITGGTGNFYVEGDNLEINEGSSPFLKVTGTQDASVQITAVNEAYINLRTQVESYIRMEGDAENTIVMETDTSTATGNTFGDGTNAIEFKHKEDGIGATFRGKMGLLRDTTENVDYIGIENTVGSTEYNKLEVRQDETRFTRDIKLENPVGHDAKLIIDCSGDVAATLPNLAGISFRQSVASNAWTGDSATPQIDIVGSYHGLNIVLNRGDSQDVLSGSTRDFSILEIQNRNISGGGTKRIYLGNANQGYGAYAVPAMPDNNVSTLSSTSNDKIMTANDVYVATQSQLTTSTQQTVYFTSNRTSDGFCFAYDDEADAKNKTVGNRIITGPPAFTASWTNVDSRYFSRSAGSGKFYAKLSLRFSYIYGSKTGYSQNRTAAPVYVEIKSVETSGNVSTTRDKIGYVGFDVSSNNNEYDKGDFFGWCWITIPPNATHTIHIMANSIGLATANSTPPDEGGTNYYTGTNLQDNVDFISYSGRMWALEAS